MAQVAAAPGLTPASSDARAGGDSPFWWASGALASIWLLPELKLWLVSSSCYRRIARSNIGLAKARQNLLFGEAEEAFLVIAYLMQVNMVEPGVNALLDEVDVFRRVWSADS